jgi:hypothetical protein
MNRALHRIQSQPDIVVVPVLRHPCNLPKPFSGWNPLLYADLCDDQQPDPWAKVFQQCDADLGTTAPAWLTARDEVVRLLKDNQSVNLRVVGKVAWRPLLEHIQRDYLQELALVDLEAGTTNVRHRLLAAILQVLGIPIPLLAEPNDLAEFERLLLAHNQLAHVSLIHFDWVQYRPQYGVDLFGSLRYLMEQRKLVLLVQSHIPFMDLLPRDHPLSEIDIKTVDLRAQP